MDTKSQDRAHSSLNVVIEALNLTKENSGITPAKVVSGSVSTLLTMIRDTMANDTDYVELGLACADVCKVLDQGTSGRQLNELASPVREAITQLTTTVAEIQEKVAEKGGRNTVSQVFNAKDDKEMIASRKLDLNRILRIFNTELTIDTHVEVPDLHRNVLTGQEGTDNQRPWTQASVPPGEQPPPRPRVCFGRDELIEKIIGLAESLTPTALIGAGGIGKTTIALTVLNDDRIRQRFGDDRRFIRCDQFPASRAHFLNRLSKVIGAGIENPEDLAPLRPFLSSKEMVIILDNAESILDPRGTNALEIYGVVEELSQFNNVWLCITSRISTTPPGCKILDIPTLSMEAARDAFYRIHKNNERSNLVDNILEQLDFHALSVTLLATVAHHNKWDNSQLNKEREQHWTDALQTKHNRSLTATIELSLASPTFQQLGPGARELLGVIAFFPQGVDENADWLLPTKNIFNRSFPTIPERKNIFDKFCALSLTYRADGFITMLAPLRDHLSPKDPKSSPLLRKIKKRYFTRLSARIDPDKPNFKGTQWITSEDVNVEHLLDILTSVDVNSVDVWDACASFMRHLRWHKKRLVVLGPKIEGLPDDHRSKQRCLFQLSKLFGSVGNYTESKRLLTYTLELQRGWWNSFRAAETLTGLANANRLLGLPKEGIPQAKKALKLYKRYYNTVGQSHSLLSLVWLLYSDDQLDAAEQAASQVINLLPKKGGRFMACECQRVLGEICGSRGETEKAIDHFETALKIASSSGWHGQQFWIHCSLALFFSGQGRFDDAQTHVEHTKSYAINDLHHLGRAMQLQASLWYQQYRLEEAKSEALRAADVHEKIGAMIDLESCRNLLRVIERAIEERLLLVNQV